MVVLVSAVKSISLAEGQTAAMVVLGGVCT